MLLDGTDLRELSPVRAARHVAALPQERGDDFELTVREVVAMGRTPYERVDLLALLRAARRTTLVSLHDLNAAASVCDRLHVLHAGSVVASGPPREVLTGNR